MEREGKEQGVGECAAVVLSPRCTLAAPGEPKMRNPNVQAPSAEPQSSLIWGGIRGLVCFLNFLGNLICSYFSKPLVCIVWSYLHIRIQEYIHRQMCVPVCNISGRIQENESVWLSLMQADQTVACAGRGTDFSILPFYRFGILLLARAWIFPFWRLS